MKYEVNQELLQAVIDYLVERPYKEVASLINGLAQVKPTQPLTESPEG